MNRVFDSSGPEGRVRGTPQQIIDKYQTLARDAQLAGDRVATENYLQHSEHYSRLLGVAQREMAERQEQQQKARERNDQQPQSNVQNNDRPVSQQPGTEAQPDVAAQQPQPRENAPKQPQPVSDDVLGASDENAVNSLVETPENVAVKPAPKPRPRKRAPAKVVQAEPDGVTAVPEKTSDDQTSVG